MGSAVVGRYKLAGPVRCGCVDEIFTHHQNQRCEKMGRSGGNSVGKSGREGQYSPPIDLYRRQVRLREF